MKEALFYHKSGDKIVCDLCPHNCSLSDGKTGVCRVRTRYGDGLSSDNYGLLTAINFDPIEKKPLYHFHPGKMILSLGSNGCNLKCKCCQNWDIAQSSVNEYHGFKQYEIDDIIKTALSKKDNTGIAFTYNEPTVWYEYMLDIAEESKKNEMNNVMVSNGYINVKPLKKLIPFIDAFNIDLKGFTEDFYRKVTSSSLEPVKLALKQIKRSGKHLEVTNLIIPGLNDEINLFNQMISWIREELGEDTVLHLSRYFPTFQMDIEQTPHETMLELYHLAREKLHYVYLGNVNIQDAQNTTCPNCSAMVVKRTGYYTDTKGMNSDGSCAKCNTKIIQN